jgi:hypothetical protein
MTINVIDFMQRRKVIKLFTNPGGNKLKNDYSIKQCLQIET